MIKSIEDLRLPQRDEPIEPFLKDLQVLLNSPQADYKLLQGVATIFQELDYDVVIAVRAQAMLDKAAVRLGIENPPSLIGAVEESLSFMRGVEKGEKLTDEERTAMQEAEDMLKQDEERVLVSETSLTNPLDDFSLKIREAGDDSVNLLDLGDEDSVRYAEIEETDSVRLSALGSESSVKIVGGSDTVNLDEAEDEFLDELGLDEDSVRYAEIEETDSVRLSALGSESSVKFVGGSDTVNLDEAEDDFLDEFGLDEDPEQVEEAVESQVDTYTDQVAITPDQWALAMQYFEGNPKEVKFFRKAESGEDIKSKASTDFLKKKGFVEIGHSFVNIDGQVYALQPGKVLGTGGFGAVKRAFDEEGNSYAMKIQIGSIKKEEVKKAKKRGRRQAWKNQGRQQTRADEEAMIAAGVQAESDLLQGLGRGAGMAKRVLDSKVMAPKSNRNKKYKGYNTKYYITMEFVDGSGLTEFVANHSLSEKDKLIVARECVQRLKELHELDIIHCDAAARNFMVNKEGEISIVKDIDLGLAVRLKKGEDFVDIPASEVRGLATKDIFGAGLPLDDTAKIFRFDKNYDTYVVGKLVFKDVLNVDTDINGKDMLHRDPTSRPSDNEIILDLNKRILALSQQEFDSLKTKKRMTDNEINRMVELENEIKGMKDIIEQQGGLLVTSSPLAVAKRPAVEKENFGPPRKMTRKEMKQREKRARKGKFDNPLEQPGVDKLVLRSYDPKSRTKSDDKSVVEGKERKPPRRPPGIKG